MNNKFDELAKELAQSATRRDALEIATKEHKVHKEETRNQCLA